MEKLALSQENGNILMLIITGLMLSIHDIPNIADDLIEPLPKNNVKINKYNC